MAKFLINGNKPLGGEVSVSGAKNAALKVFAATLAIDGPSVIANVPEIEDIHRIVEIIKDLGAKISKKGSEYTVDPSTINKTEVNPKLHQKLRSSILIAGPILLKKGEVTFSEPGGCVLGKRPIDYFLEGYKAFGVEIQDFADGYRLYTKKLKPAKIVFPRVSHTATEAMMTFASRIPGKSVLVNAAMEPEVVALAEFLNSCGAKISGAGTSVITIEGVESLSSGKFVTIADRIEAGTFAVLGAAANAPLKVTGINPRHLDVFWALLKKANVNFELGEDYVQIKPSKKLVAIPKDLVTHEYPGFATDLQAPMTVLMTQALGNSLIFETIYDGRLFYVDYLKSMGANILMADPHRVLVTGPTKLVGKKIFSPDIRAGIALVIAGLIAEGTTEIDNIYPIDRGYENIEARLRSLGADIQRIN
jgi:UDP-N-acetylglucosamine 1-carboxyvinyltransferase